VKAALIPAKGYYATATLKSDFHLVLAQIEDKSYKDTYTYTNIDEDSYVIVDNGAAEGSTVDDEQLLEAVRFYSADEVVIPDVMGDMKATIERKDKFLKSAEATDADHGIYNGVHFMGVVQGQTFDEVAECIDNFLDDERIDVIGVPRHLLTTFKDSHARFHVLMYMEKRKGWEQKVHLLGTNNVWPSEILGIAQQFPWVRSCDSSLPYNYTIGEARLDEATELREHIGRPDGYFTRTWELDMDLLNDNIDTYLGWARGTEGTRS
jgi:hypothetical protein